MTDRRDVASDVPYVVLSGAVLLLVVLHTANQHWSGDFFAHAASVRELSRRPWAPMHPMLPVQAQHPFMTPYTLAAGLIARYTGGSAIATLAILGVGNTVALLVALRLLSTALLGPRVAFYALLLSLTFWGADPWRYSGFIHLNALGFVVAYPSALAMAVTLACWYALRRYLTEPARRWQLVLAIGPPFVLLAHPMTGLVLAAGLVALSARDAVYRPRFLVPIVVATGITCLAAVALWPYYPWFTLIASGSHTYSDLNLAMYEDVIKRAWPLALALPVLVRRARADVFDPLLWLVALLGVIYGAGALTSNGALGRVLPALALALHLAVADGMVALERHWTPRSRVVVRLLHLALAVAVLAGTLNMTAGLVRAIPPSLLPASLASDPRLDRVTDHYAPVVGTIGPDDVVMADVNCSRNLPAFAGKVVNFFDPEPFVADERERREAVARFFGNATSDQRTALLDRYGVRFIAVDKMLTPLTDRIQRELTSLGELRRDDERLLIIERRNYSPATSLEEAPAAPRQSGSS